MKHKNGFVQSEKGRLKNYIVLFGIIFTVAALAVTSLLFAGVFDKKSQKVAVELAPPAEIHKSIDLSSNGSYSYTGAGAINNGTYINMAATGSGYYYITLPKGSYQVELWGGQGGAKSPSGGTGGRGGYVKASYEVTATSASLYFFIGTKGTDASGSIDGGMSTKYAGGYNGGGNGVGTAGPGGGGGTDVRIGGTTTGYNGTEYRVLVAAGGGGGQTQSTGDGHQAYGSQRWLGESGCTSQHSGTYPNDEGGGGGGWIGGKVTAHSDDGCQGAAGSNYVGSPFTEISNEYGKNTGDGKASIYVVSVNQPPQTKSQAITIAAKRGSPANTTITPTQVASDPNNNNVYFTATGTDTGLYTNGSGGGLDTVKKYFSWEWSSGNLVIKSVKMYPRAGVDGYTAANGFPVYAYMRDDFSTPAYAYILFYLKVGVNTVSTTTAASSAPYFLGSSNKSDAPDSAWTPSASSIYSPNGTSRYTIICKTPLKLNESFTVNANDLLTGAAVTAGLDQTFIVPSALTDAAGSYQVTGTAATIYNSSKTAVSGAYSSITVTAKKPSTSYLVFTATLYCCEKTTAYGTSYNNTCADIGTVTVDIVFRTVNTRPVLKGFSNIVEVAVNETKSLSLNTYFSDVDDATISSSTHVIKQVIVPTGEFVLLDRDNNVVNIASPNQNLYNIGSATVNTATAQSTTPTNFNSNIIYNVTDGTGSNERQAFMKVSYSNDTLTVVGIRPSYAQNPTRSTAAGHFYLLLRIEDKRESGDTGIWLPIAFIVGKNASNTFAPVATITTPAGITSQSAVSTLPNVEGNTGYTAYFAPGAINYSGSHVIGKRLDGSTLTDSNIQPLAIDGDNFATTNGLSGWGAGLNELLRLADTTTPETVVKSVSEQNYSETGSGDTLVAENQYIRAQYFDLYIPKESLSTTKSTSRIVVGSGSPDDDGFKFVSLPVGPDQTVTDGESSVNLKNYYIIKGISITLKSATMNRYFYATANVWDVTRQYINNIRIAIRVKNRAPAVSDTAGTFGTKDVTETYSTYSTTPVATFAVKLPLGGKMIFTPYDFVTDPDITERFGALTLSNGISTDLPFNLNGITGRFDAANGRLIYGSTDTSLQQFNGLFDRSIYNSVYYSNLNTEYGKLKATTAVKSVHNNSGSAVIPAAAALSGEQPVYNDKLFFARTSDGVSDAYTYDPTGFSDIRANVTNATSYINFYRGNKVHITGASDLSIDFILVTAETRTNTPAYIDLVVRDRYGDSVDTPSASISVRLQIEVVNSRPTLKNPNTFGEIAVEAITEEGPENQLVVRTPTTMSFYAETTPEHDGLISDPDNDIPEFIASRGVLVANTPDLITDPATAGKTSFADAAFAGVQDDHNGVPLTQYVSARLVSQYELQVTALSSTKAIPSGVFIYFFVTDGHGGTAMGYVRIEVLNTAPTINMSDTGFANGFAEWTVPDPENDGQTVHPEVPLWSIESISVADIVRSRFIVGSEDARTALKNKNADITVSENVTASGTERETRKSTARDSDIKMISTDIDALHSKTVLASVGGKDINLASGTITEAMLEAAIPSVAVATNLDDPGLDATAAVAVFTVRSNNAARVASIPTGSKLPMLLFKSGDNWITRNELIEALKDKSLTDLDFEPYFDTAGRWICTDWALHLSAEQGFTNGDTMGIRLSLRDEAWNGGDTVGEETAYPSGRIAGAQRVTVSGKFVTEVFQTISSTGIVTKDEFAEEYNNTYVVEFKPDEGNSVVYVPTYDGNVSSTYDGSKTNITANAAGTHIVTDGTGSTVIKSRASGADGTLAGLDAGEVFDADHIPDGAYVYPSVINVPSTKVGDDYETIYVPMSFFGMLQDLISVDTGTGSIVYSKGGYVGYDVNDVAHSYDRNSMDDISVALSLTDGETTWYGLTLNNNPYISISTFDDYSAPSASPRTNSLSKFIDSGVRTKSWPYYNNRLSVLTVATGSDTKDELLGYEKKAANKTSFIGDGRLMYIEDQATEIEEHNFGLSFSKKYVRTASRDLILTVKLRKTSTTHINSSDENDARTVSINIHVDNSFVDLSEEAGSDSYKLHYDATSGYYVDLEMPTSSMQTFDLMRKDTVEAATVAGAHHIYYTDSDYAPDTNDKYRDRAYFYPNSFVNTKNWQEYTRILANNGTKFNNVIDNAQAKQSIYNYFKVSDMDDLDDPDDFKAYIPNAGQSTKSQIEGYSAYFTVSLINNNSVINIMSNRKTKANDIAITASVADGGLGKSDPSQAEVIDWYEKRGLVAVYADASTDPLHPTRVYYPFRTIIYDSCGVGWSNGTYLGIEFRISVTNGNPTLKEVGNRVGNTLEREYTLNLAVNDSVTVNLYDIVNDIDMFTYGSGGNLSIATSSYFTDNSKGLDRETGDYLDSPFAHDEYLLGTKTYNPSAQNFYEQNLHRKAKKNPTDPDEYWLDGGGLSRMDDTSRDVIMWMMPSDSNSNSISTSTIPDSNNLSFTVNRRTTISYNNQSISVNEYRFRLRFYDGSGESDAFTADFTFIIRIANATPTVVAATRSITMRAGDDITFVTNYYDKFIGGTNTNPTVESAAYKSSATYGYFNDYKASFGEGVYGHGNGDGQNNATGDGYWIYQNITTAACGSSYILDSTTSDRPVGNGSMHLGYLPLANDDTPWRLRIIKVEYNKSSNAKIRIQENTNNILSLTQETDSGNASKALMALHIRAVSATVNEPVKITLSDGEGGTVTCNLLITIVSSPPVARDYSIDSDKRALENVGLEGEYTAANELMPAVYRLFTVPSDNAQNVNIGEPLNATKRAKKKYDIPLRSIARDPDGDNETNNMRLYGDGNFYLNDRRIVQSSSGYFEGEYFRFNTKISEGVMSIELTATGYNPDTTKGYEELKFTIADAGNGSIDNTLVITLHIYTLYSDMTNPTVAAKNAANFTSYLAGSDVVNVKSRDYFYGDGNMETSRYAFLKLTGNTGNDGNTSSPVVDPDVSAAGKMDYTARLYVFNEFNANNEPVPIAANTLSTMFTRNANTNTFTLNRSSGIDFNRYMVGGVLYNGTAIPASPSANTIEPILRQYVNFNFVSGGTAIEFTPVASTLNKTILLYIEVEKYLYNNNSGFRRTDAVLSSGTLFKLNVQDSAPTVNSDPIVSARYGADFAAEGYAGEKIDFKIFDSRDAFGGMFADSDVGDIVTIDPLTDADYARALEGALADDSTLDWAAGEGKARAFTIDINSQTNVLSITVNRRMDKLLDGRYQSSVSFPIRLVAHDSCGATADAVIRLTVKNRNLTVISPAVCEHYDSDTNVGYKFYQERRAVAGSPGTFELVDNHYVIDAQVNFTNSLEINILDFIRDPDFLADVDAESFYFDNYNELPDISPYEYLDSTNEQIACWYDTSDGYPNADTRKQLAKITPLGDDNWHNTGLRIQALDTSRSLEAKTCIRVLDRSANYKDTDIGVFITLNIRVMNDAPYVKDGKNSTDITMIGSDNSAPQGMLFFIGDFVDDRNESDVSGDDESYEYASANTYLRIFSQNALGTEEVYSTLYSEIAAKGDSTVNSNLFTVTIPDVISQELLDQYNALHADEEGFVAKRDATNRYNQWFVITPNRGFYGEGSILITVSDGDASVNADTLTTNFLINVNVLYNAEEMDKELEPISIAACKSTPIDIGTLLPKLENKLHLDNGFNGGAVTSAGANDDVIDQSSYYTLVSVALQNETDKSYATIEQVGDTPVWMIKAGSLVTLDAVRVNVRYALKSDPSVYYDKYFRLSVIKNIPPSAKYKNITFVRYNRTDDNLRDLDDSNTIRLEAWQLCNDPDDPTGAAIRFLSAKSQVPSLVKVSLSGDKRYLTINFVARGQSEITLEVTDETGDPVSIRFLAINTDLPEGSFWLKFVANFEANQLMWWLIIGGVVLLIVLLIVIIAIMRKRKRSREELEALLVSEMELEDTMLRLAGGPYPTGYESYGYLPGGGGPGYAMDPGMMLGSGTNTPDSQVLGLAAGGGEEAQEGVAPDSAEAPSEGDAGDEYSE